MEVEVEAGAEFEAEMEAAAARPGAAPDHMTRHPATPASASTSSVPRGSERPLISSVPRGRERTVISSVPRSNERPLTTCVSHFRRAVTVTG